MTIDGCELRDASGSLSCSSQTRLSSNAALGLRLIPAETRARCGFEEDTTQLRLYSVLLRADQAAEDGWVFHGIQLATSQFGTALELPFPAGGRGCLIRRAS